MSNLQLEVSKEEHYALLRIPCLINSSGECLALI